MEMSVFGVELVSNFHAQQSCKVCFGKYLMSDTLDFLVCYQLYVHWKNVENIDFVIDKTLTFC